MIEGIIHQKNKSDIVEYLDRISADYVLVVGQEHAFYEIDALDSDKTLYEIYYDSLGNLIKYEKIKLSKS